MRPKNQTKKSYSKIQHKWIAVQDIQTFDYDNMNLESAALLISFFRWYPDYFLDLLRSPNAKYKLELPQRIVLRIMARYENVYITGHRGFTKTYLSMLHSMIKGILFPGEKISYNAPNLKQGAKLAREAYSAVSRDYPLLSKHWALRHETDGNFFMETPYGSEFSMYAPRGGNCSEIIAEEMAQEGEQGFPFEVFEKDVLGTCREIRYVNKQIDRVHPNLGHYHISNAGTRQNEAYTKYRRDAMIDMLTQNKERKGFVLDIPFEVGVLFNIRDISYVEDMKRKLTPENFLREMCVIYSGSAENPIVRDEVLASSRKCMIMEERHCGDANATYIIGYDPSFIDKKHNANCGLVVVKCTKYQTIMKRDKFKKQVVYIDGFKPYTTAYEHAKNLRQVWKKYCMDGGGTTYLVVDARNNGKSIVDELLKDFDDGLPALCCVREKNEYNAIAQKNALPVIYPITAVRAGANAKDNEAEMIEYIMGEFESGNIELLTDKTMDGVEAYKVKNNIKNIGNESEYFKPYAKTTELCEEIQNLTTEVSGTSRKEKQRSKYIPRDKWSSLKYALWLAKKIEDKDTKNEYRQINTDYRQMYSGLLKGAYSNNAVSSVRGIERPNMSDLLKNRRMNG